MSVSANVRVYFTASAFFQCTNGHFKFGVYSLFKKRKIVKNSEARTFHSVQFKVQAEEKRSR